MGHPRPLFVYFRSFRIENVDFSGIRTRIVGIEGEHADHFAVNTALPFELSLMFIFFLYQSFTTEHELMA